MKLKKRFPGFTEAWEAVKTYMPTEFQPELEEQALKFSIGEWENVLVFDTNGLLIGRVGVWEHTNTWTNYNDGDRYTVENSSVNFNFNDADWNNIGRYEVQSRQYTEKNDEPLDEPIPDETQVFTSYALYKENATNAEWETFKAKFDLPALTEEQQQQLGFTWDDVGRLSVGKTETTGVANQFREEEELGAIRALNISKRMSKSGARIMNLLAPWRCGQASLKFVTATGISSSEKSISVVRELCPKLRRCMMASWRLGQRLQNTCQPV